MCVFSRPPWEQSHKPASSHSNCMVLCTVGEWDFLYVEFLFLALWGSPPPSFRTSGGGFGGGPLLIFSLSMWQKLMETNLCRHVLVCGGERARMQRLWTQVAPSISLGRRLYKSRMFVLFPIHCFQFISFLFMGQLCFIQDNFFYLTSTSLW